MSAPDLVITQMRIEKLGSPILKLPTVPVSFPWAEGRDVAEGMFRVMYAAPGVGLAAPQVGMSLSMFVFDSGDSTGIMCNPTITPDRTAGKQTWSEGCLSVPGLRVDKERWVRVDVDGFDLDGAPQSWTCEGLEARIMQHETDHLAGRLCIARTKPKHKRRR